jgi:hypothetical protein
VRTELIELMSSKGVVDAAGAAPMDVPAAAIVALITADNPIAWTVRVDEL